MESRRAGEWDVESRRVGGSAWDQICILSLPACLVMPSYFCLFPFSSFSSQRLLFYCQSLARIKNPALISHYKKGKSKSLTLSFPQSNLNPFLAQRLLCASRASFASTSVAQYSYYEQVYVGLGLRSGLGLGLGLGLGVGLA